MPDRDPLTEKIIGAAIEVHRNLGPGLLESAYEECLCKELENADIPFERQVVLPVTYKGDTISLGFRADIIVVEQVILELKTVERILPIHEAQLLTYLKLSGIGKGLLMNFNATPLIKGIKRFVM